MSVIIGDLGEPAEDPLHAAEMATAKLANPADTIGLVPEDFGRDRPADGRLNDDFDLLIAEQPALRGEPRPSPRLLASDESVAFQTERPEPKAMVVDLSEPIVVDAPAVAAALIDNQVVDFDEIAGNPLPEPEPMPAHDDYVPEAADSAVSEYEIGGKDYSVDKDTASDPFEP